MNLYQQTLLTPEIPPNAWKAIYSNDGEPTYSKNHFISALRPMLNAKGLKKNLINDDFTIASPTDDDEARKQSIRELVNSYFVPVEEIQDLYDKIDVAIKDGYKSRGDSRKNYEDQLKNLSIAMGCKEAVWRDSNTMQSRTNSMLLYGVTGAGKTTAYEHCLSLYQQVIWHEQTNQCQIVHLTVDLSGIQTPIEYCERFLAALENALGTEKYNHEIEVTRNISTALMKIETLVLTYNVGIVIIDSLESIADWKGVDRKRLLKHLTSLGKKIPLLYVGTPDVMQFLAIDMSWLLKNLSFGSIHWDPLKIFECESDNAKLRWELFTKRIWKLQCLKNVSSITEKQCEEWYSACQGIMQFAVLFFSLCQTEAISCGEEALSVELMKRVRRKEFKPFEHLLRAFKENDISFFSVLKGVGNITVENQTTTTKSFKLKVTNSSSKSFKKPVINQMGEGFVRIAKKDWIKLPNDDLRYMFEKYKGSNFYDVLKADGLILSMQEVMNSVQFPRSLPR